MRLLDVFRRKPLDLATEGDGNVGGPEGSELQSYTGIHEFPPYVRNVIGDFKPLTVTIHRKIQMRYSPDVAFMSALVRNPIVNMRYAIETDGDEEIAAGLDAMLRPNYIPLAQSGSLSLLYGHQLIQPIYESKPFEFKVEDKTKGESRAVKLSLAWVLKRTKGIDPRTVTLKADPRTEEFSEATQGVEGRTIRVPADQLILWTNGLEDDWGRLTGLGVFDSAYTPWYNQAGLIFLRNSYFERRADPTPVGYFREGQGTDERDGGKKSMREIMGVALAALKGRSYVLVPGARDDKGNRYNEISYLTAENRGDMFQQAIDSDGVQILKCGLIPGESATTADSGSRARAEVHENRLGEIQQTRVDAWCKVLESYLDRVAKYHWPAERVEAARIRVKAAGLSPGQQQLYKEVLLKILDAESMLSQGESVPIRKRIDAVGMADDLGISLRPLDEAQEEWDAERTEAQAKAREISEGAAGGVTVTKDMEDQVQKDLARIGAIDDAPASERLHLGPEDLGDIRTVVAETLASMDERVKESGKITLEQLDERIRGAFSVWQQAQKQSTEQNPDPNETIKATGEVIEKALKAQQKPEGTTVNLGDITVQPAAPAIVNQGDTVINQGDVHLKADLNLKPGDKKVVEITNPDGSKSTATIKPEGGD